MRIHVISFIHLPWANKKRKKEEIQTRRQGSSKKIPTKRVMANAKVFKETYRPKLEIPEESGGVQTRKPYMQQHGGGMDIF